jgi:tetratricopeptide (TPR) repeat protein
VVTAAPPAASDYEIERTRVERALVEQGDIRGGGAGEAHRLALVAFHTYRHAALTGDPAELAAAGPAIERAITAATRSGDLHLLQAKLALKLHRLAEVRRRLDLVEAEGGCAESTALRADLAVQEGRYAEAAQVYQAALRQDRTWDTLARLAHLEAKLGDSEGAERRLVEARDELTAKEMRAFAWVEIQRGMLDFSRGQLDDAGGHYRVAARAYSGYWLVEERLAELAAAQGSVPEAIDRYHALVTRRPRPELQQALGELYHLLGDAEAARTWSERARRAYLASAARGEVHYYHHLADFYSDVQAHGGEAVRWAAADLALRPNAETRAAMAWALHLAGRTLEAVDLIEQALSTGWVDARFFAWAATINAAAGNVAAAEHHAASAREWNPLVTSFHAHH